MKAKEIFKLFTGDLVTIRIPKVFVIFAILVPIIAYVDFALIRKTDLTSYIKVCSFELILIYYGFLMAQFTTKIKEKYGGE